MKSLLAALIVSIGWWGSAQNSFDFAPVECQRTQDIAGIRYLEAFEQTDEGTLLRLALSLTTAPEGVDAITYAPLVFLDTALVYSNQAAAIACGDSVEFSYLLPGKPHALNVLVRSLPILPPFLQGLSYEEATESYRAQLQEASWAFMDVLNVILDPLTAEQLAARRDELALPGAQVTSLDRLLENHLYQPPDWQEHALLAHLDATQTSYDFGVFYQSGTETPRDVTITCLLDDQQIAAFDGAVAWGGTLMNQEAVRLEGRVEVNAPGWHLLRCVVLNGLLGNKEDPLPGVIVSTFLYKEP